MKDNLIVGKSIPTKEAFDKVTGRATYIADISLPDMLYAKVVGSLYPHAIIKEINVSKVEAMPGVKAVLTKKDISDKLFGSNFTRARYPITDHARCVGDFIAAVAAETEGTAEDAIEQIEVKYEVLPSVFDPKEAIKPDAPQLFPEGNIVDPDKKPEMLEYGDIERGLKEADFVVEGTFKMPKVVHAAIEPRACIARWSGEELEVWATTQTPYYVRKFLAEYFEIALENVTVHVCTFGGGFGGKYQEEYIVISCLLSQKSGRPVKLVYTRDMENIMGRSRWAAISEVKVGVKNDGTIVAQDVRQYYDVGAYGAPEGGSGVTMGAVNASIYKTDNCRIMAWNVCTNTITAQKFRSVYVPSYRFAIETLMDMVEEKLGMEPGELRLKKTPKTGDKIMPYGNIMGNHALETCFKKAREAINWSQKWKGWGKPTDIRGTKHRGLGIGFGVGWCDWYRERHEGTKVELYPNGKIIITTGATDIGTGNKTTISQIVAQVMGLSSVENIEVRSPNTVGTKSDVPYDEGTIASRVLFVAGWAAQLAANEVKKQLIEQAAAKLGQDTSKIELSNGYVYCVENPQEKIQLSEIIKEPVSGFGVPPLPNVVGRAKRYEKYIAPVQVHIAEVEVDTKTYEVKVDRYVAVHDVGKAINPRIVKNQIEGGVIQGISTTLYEELVFDKVRNSYLNPDFVDYKIAEIYDIPSIEVILVEESPAEYGPFGAKGIGEHPLPPVYGAIGNAVYNAVGVRPKEIPITPEKMFKWLSIG